MAHKKESQRQRIKTGETRTNEQMQEAVLSAFEECGHISNSCKEANVPRRTFYNWIGKDKKFKKAFEAARVVATGLLVDEAWRRAKDGVPKGIYYKGDLVGHELEYSDRLLELLLKANDPKTYKDRVSTEVSGPDGKPIKSKVSHVHRIIFEDNGG